MDEQTTNSNPNTDAATVMLDMEAMIKNHITDIDRQKSELKKQREMLTSTLENDETYREHDRLAKEAAKTRAATKSEILKLPANRQLAEKVKDLAVEIKELDNALSEYLREYQKMSGVSEIEGHDGEVREIVYVAKLVKKSSRFAK